MPDDDGLKTAFRMAAAAELAAARLLPDFAGHEREILREVEAHDGNISFGDAYRAIMDRNAARRPLP